MIRHLRPALSAEELADYTARMQNYVAIQGPDLFDAIFGGA